MFNKPFSLFILSFLTIILFPLVSRAQMDNYSVNLGEKLVSLAWENNPDNRVTIDQAEADRYLWNAKKYSWLNTITIYANYNEYNFKGYNGAPASGFNGLPITGLNSSGQLPYYPRYNFGIILPLGTFFTIPKQIKASRSIFQRSFDQVNSQKLEIRDRVLNKFQDYIQLNREYKSYFRSSEDSRINYLSKEKAFKSGNASYSDYSNSKELYIHELVNLLKKKKDLFVAKNDLERLVGSPIADILKEEN